MGTNLPRKPSTPSLPRRPDSLADLQRLPGVGPRLAARLRGLGCPTAESLRGRDPEELYARLMEQVGGHVDRCVLYVFRCAVHAAEHPDEPDPEKRKWWNWMDGKLG